MTRTIFAPSRRLDAHIAVPKQEEVTMTLVPKLHPLSPLLKYPGGKEKERKHILPALPEKAESYYDPFVGGGAVYLAIDADRYFINDSSPELMGLYRCVREQDESFFTALSDMDSSWLFLSRTADRYRKELLSLYDHRKSSPETGAFADFSLDLFLDVLQDSLSDSRDYEEVRPGKFLSDPLFRDFARSSFRNKMTRMMALENSRGLLPEDDLFANLEGCFKNAFYLLIRQLYNRAVSAGDMSGERIALYFFLREYCYSSMFRYNRQGEFNVPYGGLTYNRKYLCGKIDAFRGFDLQQQLSRTEAACLDFEAFIRQYPSSPEDFVFLDPPYDTDFTSYDGNEFGKADHERLASYVRNTCKSYLMLIIKDTDFIRGLYPEGTMTASGRPLQVYSFDKKYFVSFKSRNDRRTRHLLITNYPIPQDGNLPADEKEN